MSSNGKVSNNPEMPQGLFTRQPSNDEIEVLRPAGVYYPAGVVAQWITPGEGRAALNEMLSGILVLELDHLAKAAAAGESFRIDPLKELGDREGWQLESSLKDDPDSFSLVKDGTTEVHKGKRRDLLLALELMQRAALKPFERRDNIPTWVMDSREVYPQVVKALKGEPLFVEK